MILSIESACNHVLKMHYVYHLLLHIIVKLNNNAFIFSLKFTYLIN